MPVHLQGLATALPPHPMPQAEVQARAEVLLGARYPQFDRLLKTYLSAGVDMRHSVVPFDWFAEPHGWAERNEAYLTGSLALFIDAAQGALTDAGWRADEVDCIVTVSSTGIATPTLEARAAQEMGFRDDVFRVPVFGLGCAGGVSGLSLAQTIADARPDAKVLLVVVETCTTCFRTDRLQKADIIASVLFGDGAAAACLSGLADPDRRRVTLAQGVQITWPETLGIMGWDVDDTGLGVVFDRSIPDFTRRNIADAAARALSATGLEREEVTRFVSHPGGAKVIAAIEAALDLGQGALDAERSVLRRAGNMSAPTVLFVLEEVLAGPASGRMMAQALGPGFTAAFVPMEVEARAA